MTDTTKIAGAAKPADSVTDYTNWSDLILEKLHRWTAAAIKMLPNLVVAVIVFVAFFLLARLIRKFVYKVSCRLSHKEAISNLIASTAYFVVFLIGIFTALEVLKLDKAVSSLLAGAGIIGLALGFAFQDLTANFISGIYITFRKPFDVGDIIETNGFTGNVEKIQFRSSIIRTQDGLHVIIPNKDIFQKSIINHSLSPDRRIQFAVLIPFNKEPALVLKELNETLNNSIKDLGKKPDIYFENIEGANIKVMITLWVGNDTIESFNKIRSEAISRVLDALRDKKILP